MIPFKLNTMAARAGAVLFLFLAGPSQAAPILFSTPTTISGDTNVLNAGVTAYADDWDGSSGSVTVNGVAFFGNTSTTGDGLGNLTLSGAGGPFTGFVTSTAAPATSLSTNYQDVLTGGVYTGSATTITVTLNNLTSGHRYASQIWVDDSRGTGTGNTPYSVAVNGGANSVSLAYNASQVKGGLGQNTIGYFMGTSSGTQGLTLLANGNSTTLNAVQVRDITNIGYWTGTGANGTTWDNSTNANFATNNWNAALTTATFSSAQSALSGVTFADAYWNSSNLTTITNNNITIANGGISTGTVTFANSAVPYTITSSDSTGIGSATAVVVSGGGLVTLAGTNSYTGGTTITAGTLQAGSPAALGSANGTMSIYGGLVNVNGNNVSVGNFTGTGGTVANNYTSNNVTMTIGNGNAGGGNFGGVLANTTIGGSSKLGLLKTGTGTITLSGANTYSLGTTVSGGALAVTNTAGLGSGPVTVNTGGTLNFSAPSTGSYLAYTMSTLSGSGVININIPNSAQIGFANGTSGVNATSFGGVINVYDTGGTGATGYFSWFGTDSSSGTINIESNASVYRGFSNANGYANYVLYGGNSGNGGLGQLRVDNSYTIHGNITLAGSMASGQYSIFDDTAGATDTFNGNIGQINGSQPLVLGSNSATIKLTGTNTYTGNTTVGSGTLAIGGNLALQDSPLNTASGGKVTLSGVTAPTIGGLVGGVNLGTLITNYSTMTALNLNVVNGTGASYTGVIADASGPLPLTISGSNVQILAGANTYTGNTTINGGTLQIGAGGGVGSLSPSSSITTNATLAFSRSDSIVQGTQFSSGAIGGTGGLVQFGLGSLTLNVANTYQGGTLIAGGTLALSAAGTPGSGNITVKPGALFDVSAYGSGGYNFSGATLTAGRSASPATDINGSLNVANATVSPYASGSGTLNISGGLSLSGGTISSYNPGGLISLGGALSLAGSDFLALSSPLALSPSSSYTIFTASSVPSNPANFLYVSNGNGRDSYTFVASGGTAVTLSVTGSAANLTWTGGSNSKWDSGASQSWYNVGTASADYFYPGDLVLFNDSPGTATAVNINAAVLPGSLTVSNTNVNYVFSGSGSIGGSTSLLKMGPGTLTINSSNTYTGGTTLSGGVLNANAAYALGSGGTLSVAGGTLNLSAAQSPSSVSLTGGMVYANSVSALGSAAVTINGGVLNVTAAQSPASVSLLSGAINASSSGALGNGGIVQTGGTLNASAAGAIGSAGLSVGGGLANITSAAGVIVGPTTISGGTLATDSVGTLGSGVALNSGLLNIGNAAALGSGTVSIYGGTLNNTSGGPLTLITTGAQRWNNSFTFLGSNNLSLGTGAIALVGSTAVTVSAGTLGAGGTISGTGSLTQNGAGTLLLSGTNTYSGGVTISGGTLLATNTNALGTGPVNVNSGGTLTLSAPTTGSYLNYSMSSLSGSGVVNFNIPNSAQIGIVNGTSGGNATGFGGVINVYATGGTGANGYFSWFGTDSSSGTINVEPNASVYCGFSTTNTNKYANFVLYGGNSGNGTTGQLRVDVGYTMHGNITLAGSMAAGQYTIYDASANSVDTFSGNIGQINGSQPLVLASNGATILLTGTNTYSGNTTVASGTLGIGSTLALQDSPLNTAGGGKVTLSSGITSPVLGGLAGGVNLSTVITNYSTLTLLNLNVVNGSSTNYTGVITDASGPLSLTMAGSNVQVLAGNNTFTGGTTFVGGTINLGSAESPGNFGPLGKSASSSVGNIVLSGGYLQYSSANQFDYSGRFSTAPSQQYNVDTNGQAVTWATALTSPSGSLIKVGLGTLTLTGSNTYGGSTSINGGTLALNNANATSSITVDGGAALSGTGSALSAAISVSNGGILNFSQNAGSTFSAGSLGYSGSFALNVSDLNTPYGSSPVVSLGTLNTTTASTINVNVSNVPAGSGVMEILQYGSLVGAGTNAFSLVSPVSAARTTYSLTNVGNTIDLKYSVDFPYWTGSLSNAWDTSATSNWALNSTSVSTTFQTADTVIFDDRAIAYSGTAQVVNISAANVMPKSVVFSNSAASYTLQGSFGISDGTAAKTTLAVNGPGAVTIVNSNSYSGGTTLSGGTFNASGAGALGSGSLGVVGGLLNLGAAQSISSVSLIAGTINANSAGALGSGALGVSGGSINIGAAQSISSVSLSAGTINANTTGALGSGTLGVSGGLLLSTAAQTVSSATLGGGLVSFTSSGLGTGAINFTGNSTLQWQTGNTDDVSGRLTINSGATATMDTQGNSVNFASGVGGGSGSLVKVGTGVLTLNGVDTYTGGTTISAGTLVATNVSSLSSGNVAVNVGSVLNVMVPNTATLTYGSLSGAGTVNVYLAAGGNGVAQNASASGFVGTYNIYATGGSGSNANKLAWYGADSTASTINVEPNATLYCGFGQTLNRYANIVLYGGYDQENLGQLRGSGGYNWHGNITLAGSMSGGQYTIDDDSTNAATVSGNIGEINGSQPITLGGPIVFTGTNTYSGNTTVSSGTLTLGSTLALQNSPLNTAGAGHVALGSGITAPTLGGLVGGVNLKSVIANYSNLTALTLNVVNRAGCTYSGAIVDTSGLSLTLTGSGLQVLNGPNTYTGTTAISSGTLQIGPNGSLGSGNYSSAISNNSLLAFASTNTQTLAGAISGSGALSVMAGNLTLSANNGYTGGTTISGGALVAGGANTLSPSSAITLSSGLLDVTAGSQSVAGFAMTTGTLNLDVSNLLSITTGTATFGGALNLSDTSNLTLGGGSLELIAYANYSGSFAMNNASSLNGYQLEYMPHQLDLVRAANWSRSTWIATGGGSWTSGTYPNGQGATAVLGSAIVASSTITLDGAQTLGSLTFNNSNGYTLTAGSGGSLTMDNTGGTGDAQIVVLSGTHTIDSTVLLTLAGTNTSIAISGTGALNITGNILDGSSGNDAAVTVSSSDGTGLLILSGTNTFAGGLNVQTGTVILNGAGSLFSGSSLTIGVNPGPGAVFTPPAGRQSTTLAPVPEPGTLALLIVGALCGLIGFWKTCWARLGSRLKRND